jgi:hypothetical protein
MPLALPKTVSELVQRINKVRKINELKNPQTALVEDNFYSTSRAEKIWQKSSNQLLFNLLFATISVEYVNGPYLQPNTPCKLIISTQDVITSSGVIKMRWLLPPNWQVSAPTMHFGCRNYCSTKLEVVITPPENALEAMSYLHLEITTEKRNYPTIITIPFRSKIATSYPRLFADRESDGFFLKSTLDKGILASKNEVTQ